MATVQSALKRNRASRPYQGVPAIQDADLSSQGMMTAGTAQAARQAFEDAFDTMLLASIAHGTPGSVTELKDLFLEQMRAQLEWYEARS